MCRILNFGSLNVDTVHSVDHITRPGETLSATEVASFCGGKGFNQSVALARAGSTVYHAGKIGTDGGELQHQLSAAGVDCSFLLHAAGKSGNALIQRAASGENAIILYGGANKDITKEEIDEVLSHFTTGDILVSQNEISNVPYLLSQATRRGMKIALNPSPMDQEMLALPLEGITWLMINEIEGEELTGESDPEKVIEALLNRCPKLRVVLTLGGNGVMYADEKKRHQAAAFSVPVVDTTGAGDTFLGYFIAFVSSGGAIAEALETASAAAGMAVSVMGALPSIPKMDDVNMFLQQHRKQC